MSAIAGLIPKIEGFQPIPNAVMIPFMEAQSAALAYGFGLNYEYGKRKIRSMSNEQFNSLTSEDITNMSNAHTHIILSKFQAQVPNVMPMQAEIFKQYVIIEKLKVQQNVELAKWIVDYAATGVSEGLEDFFAHLTGTHAGHTTTTSTPLTADEYAHTLGTHAGHTTTTPTTPTTTTIPTTPTTSSHSKLTYTWFHPVQQKNFTKTTTFISKEQHRKNVLDRWNQYKVFFNANGKTGTGTAIANEAIAYSHAWAKHYSEWFVGLN